MKQKLERNITEKTTTHQYLLLISSVQSTHKNSQKITGKQNPAPYEKNYKP